MGQIDYLLSRARLIRDENQDGANTAERVGSLFVDMLKQMQDEGMLTSKQLKEINEKIAKLTPVFLSEFEYEKLLESGDIDPELIYMTYEEE